MSGTTYGCLQSMLVAWVYLTEVTEADYKKIFDRLLNDFDYVKNNLVEERHILSKHRQKKILLSQ